MELLKGDSLEVAAHIPCIYILNNSLETASNLYKLQKKVFTQEEDNFMRGHYYNKVYVGKTRFTIDSFVLKCLFT